MVLNWCGQRPEKLGTCLDREAVCGSCARVAELERERDEALGNLRELRIFCGIKHASPMSALRARNAELIAALERIRIRAWNLGEDLSGYWVEEAAEDALASDSKATLEAIEAVRAYLASRAEDDPKTIRRRIDDIETAARKAGWWSDD